MKINIKNKIIKSTKTKKNSNNIYYNNLFFACIIPIKNIMVRQNQIKQIKGKPLLEYEVTKKSRK